MRTVRFLAIILAAGAAARADFSYTMTRKSSGAMGSTGGDQATRFYLKGQKMVTDTGSMAMILDFDAATVTTINKADKTYSVTPFAKLGQGTGQPAADVQVDVKETGQHKNINGFDATQAILTIQADVPQARGGMKMQMEMEIWVSPEVPGAQEMHAFYQRNAGKFPWSALAGGSPGAKSMAEMQRKLAGMNGVPVLEIVRMKPSGGMAMPQMNPGQAAQMQAARQRLEAMAAQGGPQGDAAKQALARMDAAMGGGGGGGAMFETTMEASGFATSSIPDSVFAVPAGFAKTEGK